MKKARFLALFLCILMVVSMLVSCTPAQPVDNPSGKSDGNETAEGYDFGGEIFYFSGAFIPRAARDYTQEEIDEGLLPASYSVIEEAMMNKTLETEKKLNCEIHMDPLWADTAADFAIMAGSGEFPVDIVYNASTLLRDLYVSGLVADLTTIKAIDLKDEAKWGSAASMSRVQIGESIFGIPEVGSRYYPFNSCFYGVVLQKNSAFTAWQTDWTVWEVVESGDWTFDNFVDLIDDVSDDNHYAIGVLGTTIFEGAMAVNEAIRVVFDEELNKYVCGLCTEATYEAIEFSRSLYLNDRVKNEGVEYDAIVADEYTFLFTSGYRFFDQITKATSDVSWIPFPYGPHSVYGESTAAFGLSNAECVTGVFNGLVTDENPDEETQKNGVVFNELFGEISIGEYVDYDEYMQRNIFNQGDDKGWNVYKQYSANIHSPFVDELSEPLTDAIRSSIQMCLADPSLDIPAQMATLEDVVNNQLDVSVNNR